MVFRRRLLLSHYSWALVFSHLFGMFHLHKSKRIIRLARQGKGWVFELVNKKREDREHSIYWRFLAEHPELTNDPFFYENSDDAQKSDGAHRNRANYADHLNAFPVFKALSEEYLAERIKKIAEIQFSSVPRPDIDRFPDIGTVQRYSLTTES